MKTRNEGSCPACPHSMSGYHIAHPPSTTPAQPKASDENLECVWCNAWCVRDGKVCNSEVVL